MNILAVYPYTNISSAAIMVNGKPIVCTPEDAIRPFYSCGLDILVIGDYIIEK